MVEKTTLESTYHVLLAEEIKRKYDVKEYHDRELYSKLKGNLAQRPKIIIVAGLRGIGKTTLILHLASKTEHSLFFSLDHPLFGRINLYEFIKYLVNVQGITSYFIDEAHQYINWSKEIKALHDWNNNLSFVISGSSALGLSIPDRRSLSYHLPPLTFKEYLRYSNKEIKESVEWQDYHQSMELVIREDLEKYFDRYLLGGGFLPFLSLSGEDFSRTLFESIRKSVREDAVMYGKMNKEKITYLEKILTFIALSPPGELSYTSLCSSLGVGKGTVIELIDILQQMEIIRILTTHPTSSVVIRKQPKLLFSHPNLRNAVSRNLNVEPNLGAIREEFVVFHLINAGYSVYTIKGEKRSPDYVIEKNGKREIIEIGGHSKGTKQLKDGGIVVKEHNLITIGLI